MLDIFWIFLIIFLSIFGITVSKRINYVNYNIFRMFKSFKEENKLGLFMTLGTKIGVGSLIGTTAAIYVGGAGALFWIWIFSILTSSLIYLETKIGSKYKEKVSGVYTSGPYYIIKNALNKKRLALFTGLLLVITYSFIFLMVQTNTISYIILLNISISKILILIILIFFLLLTIIFNLKELLKLINYLVPIMCILFTFISLYVVLKNVEVLPNIFKNIIESAFDTKSFLVGFLVGIKRSIFLNEILIGTTSSTGLVGSKNEENVSSMQVLGSYFITFIIGTLNSIMVLLFLNNNTTTINNYNELINNVFIYHLGNLGSFLLIVLLLLFGITTIISGIYIGISNLEKMIKNKYIIFIFKIFVVLFCCIGLYINVNLMWKIIDVFLLLLLLINGSTLYKIVRGNYDWK